MSTTVDSIVNPWVLTNPCITQGRSSCIFKALNWAAFQKRSREETYCKKVHSYTGNPGPCGPQAWLLLFFFTLFFFTFFVTESAFPSQRSFLVFGQNPYSTLFDDWHPPCSAHLFFGLWISNSKRSTKDWEGTMGLTRFEKLPEDAVPLTRSSDIKLVLDTPKGVFFFILFFFIIFEQQRRGGSIVTIQKV